MSYAEKGGNPYHRSWANPGPDMTPIIKTLARISANSVTTYAQRHEKSEQFAKLLNEGLKKQEELKLNFPSFSEHQKKTLEKQGYAIYQLSGLSLKQMLDDHSVVRTWNKEDLNEKEISFKGEVAVNPYRIEIRDTSGKDFKAQKHIFNNFKTKLEKQLPGVTAKMLSLADCIDLELAHKSEHGRGILDRYYIGGVRTTTAIYDGYNVVLNTAFSKSLKLNISILKNTEKSEHVGLGAIVIPTGSNWDGKTHYY